MDHEDGLGLLGWIAVGTSFKLLAQLAPIQHLAFVLYERLFAAMFLTDPGEMVYLCVNIAFTEGDY